MKLLVVLAAMLGVIIATTTQWPEHNCTVDHRSVPGNPHAYELSDLAGNWVVRMCEPDHLVFVMAAKCFCGWSDPELTYGNCSDVNRQSLVSPGLDYMFEYWHPVDNVWKERNCHDTFPPGFAHNNAYVFFNVTGCRCDWTPGHPEYVGPPVTADCTMEMDIEMNQTPPNDTKGSLVQTNCPDWKVWPPKVAIGNVGGRVYMRCNNCSLKSWVLADNEKKDMCMYFGLYSTAQDNPGDYRVVLADSCINYAGVVFPAKFLFEYQASPMSFRVTFHGGVWTYNPGGSGVGSWVDVVLCYRSGSWFTVYVDGFEVPAVENNPPDDWAVGVNAYFKIQNCQLNICGDPLNLPTHYTGCIDWFQEMAGGACPIDLRPPPPLQ